MPPFQLNFALPKMRILQNYFLFLLLHCVVAVLSDVTPSFIRVTKFCPRNITSFGEILVLSDNGVMPYASCKGREYNFIQVCPSVYRLRFRHFGNPDKQCLSTRLLKEYSYAVQVNLLDEGGLLFAGSRIQIVRCPIYFNWIPKSNIHSDSKDLIFENKKEAATHNASKTHFELASDVMVKPEETRSSTVRLSIQVHGWNKSINLAKLQLYSLMTDPPLGIIGVSPIKCAISYDNKIEDLLHYGCGTGSILSRSSGFQVQGITSLSPAFLLAIPSGSLLSLSCSFAVCKNKCDGSSCRSHRLEITEVYNSSIQIFFNPKNDSAGDTVLHSEDPDVQVFPSSRPPLQNDPVDTDDDTPPRQTSPVTFNLPLIIALCVLLPIISILVIALCIFRSRVNSGAYHVQNRTNR